MKNYGDITKINGAEVEPVDIITGGSPCQDLSVAGKREGLKKKCHNYTTCGFETDANSELERCPLCGSYLDLTRSGLFMEQIRIIKEMREHDRRVNGRTDEHIRPRYMVWENVPGAFSSHKGEDFRAVLEETAKVAEGDACIPRFEGGAGHQQDASWEMGGALLGEYTMRSFGECPNAVRESRLSQILEEAPHPKYCLSAKACLGILRRAEKRGKVLPPMLDQALRRQAGLSVFKNEPESQGGGKGILIQNEHVGCLSTLNNQSVCAFEPGAASRVGGHVYSDDVAGTVRANAGDNQQAVVYGISAYDSNAMKSDNPNSGIYEAETARTLDLNGGSPACNQGGMAVVCATTEMTPKTDEDGVSFSLRSRDYKDPQIVCLEGNGSRPSHKGDGYAESDTMYTLNSTEHHAVCIENHPADSRVKVSEDGIVQTLSSRMGTGGGNVPMVMESINGEISGTLDASYYKGCGERQGVEREVVCVGNGQLAQARISDKVGALNCMHDQQAVITYGLDRASFNQGINAQYDFAVDEEKIGTQVAKGPGAVYQSVVRRLTPMECERLQNFPDHWTDIGEWVDSKGKKHKDADSPRYKALGNSIALPFWLWMAERMVAYLEEEPTMASLFDGISGFCLVFARAGVKPVFSSEIEEFPIAVAKKHFGDDDLGLEGDYERYL